MQDLAITSSTIRKTALDSMSAVDIQKRVIAAMRYGDPGLPFAEAILCILEQSAATAKLNLAFYPLSIDGAVD